MSSVKCQVPGVKCQVSKVKCQMSNQRSFKIPVECADFRLAHRLYLKPPCIVKIGTFVIFLLIFSEYMFEKCLCERKIIQVQLMVQT